MEEQKQIVEIGGVKLEVDLRNAKVIENYKIGDNVRLLQKDYGDKYKTCPGVIVAFDSFEKLPTIVVAYLEINYDDAKIKFAYINKETYENGAYEIAPANYIDETRFKKASVVSAMDKDIAKKEEEIEDIKRKKEYFLEHFSKYFTDFAKDEVEPS